MIYDHTVWSGKIMMMRSEGEGEEEDDAVDHDDDVRQDARRLLISSSLSSFLSNCSSRTTLRIRIRRSEEPIDELQWMEWNAHRLASPDPFEPVRMPHSFLILWLRRSLVNGPRVATLIIQLQVLFQADWSTNRRFPLVILTRIENGLTHVSIHWVSPSHDLSHVYLSQSRVLIYLLFLLQQSLPSERDSSSSDFN